jgi:hypothetical protein
MLKSIEGKEDHDDIGKGKFDSLERRQRLSFTELNCRDSSSLRDLNYF